MEEVRVLGMLQENQQPVTGIFFKQYENMPFQIYWKFYHQNMKIFRRKILIFFIFLLKT